MTQQLTDKINQLESTRSQLLTELAEKNSRLEEMANTAHELIKSQSNLQSLLHSATEGFIILNSEGNIQSINKAGEAIFGYAEIELIHQAPGCLFYCPPEYKNDIPEFLKFQEHKRRSQKHTDYDAWIPNENPIFGIDHNDELIPLAVTYSEVIAEELVLFSDDSLETGLCEKSGQTNYELFGIIFRDLRDELRTQTELRKNHEQLHNAYLKLSEANELQSQIMANISHELRTPLNGILGIGELLKQSPLSQAQTQYVEAIVDSGTKLLAVVDNLINHCKLQNNVQEPILAPLDLRALAESVTRQFEKKLTSTSQRLSMQVCANDKQILSDQQHLRVIASNLLDNAIKFCEAGEINVLFSLDEVKNHLIICVSDQGIGIPSDKHKIIFEPFVQVDGSISRTYGGIGMGLAVTKQMVEDLYGEIQVTNNPDKGVTFTVRLPVKIHTASNDAEHNSGTSPLPTELANIAQILGESFPAFVSSFRAETEVKMAELKLAIAGGSFQAAAALCDNLCTACHSLGVSDLPERLSTLRQDCLSGSPAQSMLIEIDSLYSNLCNSLQSKLDSGTR